MRTEHSAIKVIILMGVLAAVFLLLTSFSLKKSIQPNTAQKVKFEKPQSPFAAARACKDLRAIVTFGPRPAGSEASAATRQYIRRELSAAGITSREQVFDVENRFGTRHLANIIATINGSRDGILILAAHYDTKSDPEKNLIGANDGGSGTAWLLEMARILGPRRQGRSLWLVWFDGQEAFEPEDSIEALHGSEALVRELREQGKLAQVSVMINVAMIGDCYLDVTRNTGAPDWLWETIYLSAENLGYQHYFARTARESRDDYLSFQNARVPAINLFDGIYGGSPIQHQKLYHTEDDTLDKVCEQSLQAIGDVLYHALPAIDADLDRAG